MKKLAIEMENIINEMRNQPPHCLFGYYVLLPAVLAIAASYDSAAV